MTNPEYLNYKRRAKARRKARAAFRESKKRQASLQGLLSHKQGEIDQLQWAYKDLTDNITSLCKHSVLLPPDIVQLDGKLPPNFRIAVYGSMPTFESGFVALQEVQAINLIRLEYLAQDDTFMQRVHIMLRSKDGQVNYYFNKESLFVMGRFRKDIVEFYVRKMMKLLVKEIAK